MPDSSVTVFEDDMRNKIFGYSSNAGALDFSEENFQACCIIARKNIRGVILHFKTNSDVVTL